MIQLEDLCPELLHGIVSFLEIAPLGNFRCTNKALCAAAEPHFRTFFRRICITLERCSLERLSRFAESNYGAEARELFVYLLTGPSSSRQPSFRDFITDQDCISNTGLDLIWLTSSLRKLRNIGTVRIMDGLFGAVQHGYPLGYTSFLSPGILGLPFWNSETELAHTVLVVMTAIAEADITPHTFDILLGHGVMQDDEDLHSVDSFDSNSEDTGYVRGIDLPALSLSGAYLSQIDDFLRALRCLRIHVGYHPGNANHLEQFVHRADGLQRLDLRFDNPAAPWIPSLMGLHCLPQLAELTLAGLVMGTGHAEAFFAKLSSLKRLKLCHVMLEERSISIEGWKSVLTCLSASQLNSLTLHKLGVQDSSRDWRPVTVGGATIAIRFTSHVRRRVLQLAEELQVDIDPGTVWIAFCPDDMDQCLLYC